MLTCEIRINGMLLGHLYLVNMLENNGKMFLYSVEYYRTGKGTIKTMVRHDPNDGPEKLVQLAMTAIVKRKDFKEMINAGI